MRRSQRLSVGLVFDDSLDSSDGVAQYVKTLGAWLSLQGHEVTYIVGQSRILSRSEGEVISASDNLKIRWGGNRLTMPIWPKKRLIRDLLSERDFDVLHVQVPYSPLMAQYVINKAPERTAVVGTFHVYPSSDRLVWGSRLLKIIYGKSLRRFDEMFAVSPAAARYAASGFGLQTGIMPNVVDIARFENKAQKKAKKRIVFLGRLVERKGCLQLLKAFQRLNERQSDVELIIAGDGPLRQKLERFVIKNGLDDAVSFKGYIEESDKPSLLGCADIACFPSLYGESFGIVLIEAMASGAGIVLGGDNPGYRSVLGEMPELLINPNDIAGFASRLEELLKVGDRIHELHSWQRQTVEQYDINAVGARITDHYGRQIAKRRKKSNN